MVRVTTLSVVTCVITKPRGESTLKKKTTTGVFTLKGKDIDCNSTIDPNQENVWQSLHGRIGSRQINSPGIMFSTGPGGKKMVRFKDSHGHHTDFMSVDDFAMIIRAGSNGLDAIAGLITQ